MYYVCDSSASSAHHTIDQKYIAVFNIAKLLTLCYKLKSRKQLRWFKMCVYLSTLLSREFNSYLSLLAWFYIISKMISDFLIQLFNIVPQVKK